MAGLAIVANNYPEMKRIVKNEELGEVVNYHNIEEIRNAIKKVIKKENLETYKKNSQNARKKYSWEVDESKLLEILKL